MPSPKRTDEPTIAVAYTRVSTKREDMLSPELQAHEQDTYAARHGIPIVERVEDLDLSGREFARRSVDHIVAGIRDGRWNTVLLWKWSRWGRNLLQSRLYLAEVEAAGGRVIAVTEDFDTTTSAGKFSRDQMLMIAELQSNQISDSWKEAHARRRRLGLPHTTAPRFGYLYSKADGYTPDPVTAPVLRSCYERYMAGEGMRRLALDLNANGHRSTRGNLFSPTSIARVMDNGFAAGLIRERSEPPAAANNKNTMAAFDIWRPGSHDPLIPLDLWESYRAKRQETALKAPRLRVPAHTLSGLVVCRQCQKTMISARNGERNYHVWRCLAAQTNRTCPGAVASNRRLESLVRSWVLTQAKGGDTIEADTKRALASQQAITNLKSAEAEIHRLKTKRKRLLSLYTDGLVDKSDYQDEKSAIDEALTTAESAAALAKSTARTSATAYRPIFTTLANLWDNATPPERRELLSKVITRIEVSPGPWSNPTKATIIPRWSDA
ncbi:DNA invertase Pin-like site-specific DNA recombinase [Actinocorallia herbida]|uniref:DNA invertase Pin-like site-specific DNA recombinase n=1 Tax=Actinocorallia herbida TaxID=58109 RepID=A0A3N1D7R8_9ACTN|nr:recombinase family protein [Actinocorallia herbida]ROO89570.1 DNA invertase Pin-like site-specific DNA recombinase [Actinocorallia herbida]